MLRLAFGCCWIIKLDFEQLKLIFWSARCNKMQIITTQSGLADARARIFRFPGKFVEGKFDLALRMIINNLFWSQYIKHFPKLSYCRDCNFVAEFDLRYCISKTFERQATICDRSCEQNVQLQRTALRALSNFNSNQCRKISISIFMKSLN